MICECLWQRCPALLYRGGAFSDIRSNRILEFDFIGVVGILIRPIAYQGIHCFSAALS
jgi:hypothetical protein